MLQIGTDSSRVALGLHPRLTGLKQIFDQGRLALIQRTGYENQSRSHFLGHRHLVDGRSRTTRRRSAGSAAISTRCRRRSIRWSAGTRRGESAARAAGGARRGAGDSERRPATRSRARTPAPKRRPSATPRCASPRTCRSIGPSWRSSTAARRPRWPRSIASPSVATLRGRRSPIRTPASARRCRRSPARWSRSIGTRVFYVTTGGFDTHSGQNVNAANGAYYNLMATLNDGAARVLQRSARTRGCSRTRWCSASRSSAAASTRTAARAPTTAPASVMMAMGGRVNGGLYGTAPDLNPDPQQPDAREQRRRRPLRNRLPLGLRAGHRQLAGRRLAGAARRRLPQSRRSTFI